MNSTYKSFSIVTFTSILTRAMSFVFKIFLSRYLGAKILGQYQIAFSVFLLFSCISTSGIGVTTSRMIAENSKDNASINKIMTSSIVLSLLLAFIPFIITILFPSILKIFVNDISVIQIIYILSPMLITTSLYTMLRSFLWGKKEFNLFSLTELLDEIFKIFFTIILTIFISNKFIDNLYIYAIALILGDVALLIVLIFILKKKHLRFARPIYIKPIIKSSTPITTSRLLASILSFFIAILLPTLLVSKYNLTLEEATSEFGRASGMVMSLIFAPNAFISSISIISIPDIAQLKSSGNLKLLSKKLNTAIFASILISCIFFIVFSSMGDELSCLLYNDIYVGKYLTFASIMIIPIGINSIISSYLNTLNKEKTVFYSYIISAIFLVLIILFTPKYIGIYSYFVALIVFHILNCIFNLFAINKCSELSIQVSVQSIAILIVSIITIYLLKIIKININLPLFSKTILLIIIEFFIISAILSPFYTYFFRKSPKSTLY